MPLEATSNPLSYKSILTWRTYELCR